MNRLLFSILFPLAAFAGDASISGRVVDPAGTAVAHAAVRVFARSGVVQRSAESGADGAFRIDALPAGEYLIEARTAGLDQPAPRPVTLGASETAQVELKLAVAVLATSVEVTSAAAPQLGVEGGKALDQLDAAALERRQESQLSEALRGVAGLRVQQLGGPGAFTRILTRGLRAIDTAVLIDGVRLRDAAAVQGDAAAYIGDLMLINTDRVEVLRGSGSSLYGTNAMSGVVNIVSDMGGGSTHGAVSLEGGGLGLARALARAAGGLGDGRLDWSAGVAHLNVSRGTDGIEWVRNTSAQGGALFRPRAGAQLSARVFRLTDAANVTTNPDAAPESALPQPAIVKAIPFITYTPNLFDPDSRRSTRMTSGLFGWSQQATPRIGYRVNYHLLDSRRRAGNGPAGPGMWQPRFNSYDGYDGRVDTLQARADIALARRNLVSAGYEFERERAASRSWDLNPDPAARIDARTSAIQRSSAVFFHDQLRLFSDRLQVSLSGRYQHFALLAPVFAGGAPSYKGVKLSAPPDALTGDASVSWFMPRSSTKLRAHVGNAYRAPSLYERFGAYFFMGSFSAMGDPRLSPERSVSFDTGIDQYFARNRYRLGATYFYSRLQETIGYGMLAMPDPFDRWGGYLNTKGGLARGVELAAEARLWRRASLQSSYTYTNADERKSNLIGGSLRAIRVFPHSFSLTATQELTRRLQVTADFFAASRYIAGTFFTGSGNRPFEFEGPRKLDLAASYTFPLGERRTLRAYVRAENLLNQRYFEDGFRTPRAWAVAGLKFGF